MTRIKSHNVQVGGSFVVPIEESLSNTKLKEVLGKEQEIILAAEMKAQEIIANANLQAQEIIEQAQAQALSEVDTIKSEAHQEGFEEGMTNGLDQIRNDLKDKIVSVENFAECTFDIKKSIIKSAHLDIIDLVTEISKKVCAKSLDLDKEVLKEITLKAIQSLKDKEDITIIVNPEMATKIYAISDELKEKIPQLQSIKIIEDTSVSPDGTIVESPLSRVDSRVSSQINELYEKLMTKLNSTQDEELVAEIENIPETIQEESVETMDEVQEIENFEEGS